MQLNGIASCIPVQYPTLKELETCTWIELTGDDDWEPNSTRFREQEHIAKENQKHTYETPEQAIYAMKTNTAHTPPVLLSLEQSNGEESSHPMISKVLISATYSQQKKTAEIL